MGQKKFSIRETETEKVKLTLVEFENKYSPYKSRWDYEVASQKDNTITVQIGDRGFEPPRGKGQSDAPMLSMELSQNGPDVDVAWSYSWTQWKRRVGWLVVWALLLSGALIAAAFHGQIRVLYCSVWLFCAILYGAWLLQNYMHAQQTLNIFDEMLYMNFSDVEGIDNQKIAKKVKAFLEKTVEEVEDESPDPCSECEE